MRNRPWPARGTVNPLVIKLSSWVNWRAIGGMVHSRPPESCEGVVACSRICWSPRQDRSAPSAQTIMSLALHGLIIFAAVKATQGVAETVKNRPVDTTMVFLKPPEPPAATATAAAGSRRYPNPLPRGSRPSWRRLTFPRTFRPSTSTQKAFDPKDFTGKGVEGGMSTGVAGGTGPVDVGAGLPEAELDDPVQRDLAAARRGTRPSCRAPASPAGWSCSSSSIRRVMSSRPSFKVLKTTTRVRGAGEGSHPEERVQAGAIQGPSRSASWCSRRSRSSSSSQFTRRRHFTHECQTFFTCGPRWVCSPRASSS